MFRLAKKSSEKNNVGNTDFVKSADKVSLDEDLELLMNAAENNMDISKRNHILNFKYDNYDFDQGELIYYEPTSIEINLLDQKKVKRDISNGTAFEINIASSHGTGSVNDPRLGSSRGELCETCNLNNASGCPGHEGYIRLHKEIYSPLFEKDVVHVLQSVCNDCCKVLLNERQMEENGLMGLKGYDRLSAIASICEKSKMECARKTEKGCAPCGQNRKYVTGKIKDTHKVYYESEGKNKPFPIEEVSKILKGISDEDAELLGFMKGSHPRNLIWKYVPVLSPCARIDSFMGGEISDDKILTPYREIITLNTKLKNGEENENRIMDSITNLIHSIVVKDEKANKNSHKPIKSRLGGKKGDIRDQVFSKISSNVARSVITPNPDLGLGEVNIPENIAKSLFLPETITEDNKELYEELIKAKYINEYVDFFGNKKKIVGDRNEFKLQPGMKVMRFLQDGDYVVMNRQPTLHQIGFSGFKVKIWEGKTLRINLPTTKPFNADFDGDEMNMHVPQTEKAMEELKGSQNFINCAMSGQTNSPFVGLIMNNLSAVYLLTDDDTIVDESKWLDYIGILENTDHLDLIERSEEIDHLRDKKHSILNDYGERIEYNRILTGKLLFSSFLPNDFYYKKGSVLIKNGILIKGVITGDHVGATHNSIFQNIYKIYGMERAVMFLNDSMRVLNEWLTNRGFSIHLGDCLPEVGEEMEIIKREYAKLEFQIEQMGAPPLDPHEKEIYERRIMTLLNETKTVGDLLLSKKLKKGNNLKTMIESKAKGSTFNWLQIVVSLGQQFARGKRPSPGKNDRTLSYFSPGSFGPKESGYITSSFSKGMTVSEFILHNWGSRPPMLDTALSTGESGNIDRILAKAMEGLVTENNGSVVDSKGNIVQFIYGDDGFDVSNLVNVKFGEETVPFFMDLSSRVEILNAEYGYF